MKNGTEMLRYQTLVAKHLGKQLHPKVQLHHIEMHSLARKCRAAEFASGQAIEAAHRAP